MSLLKYPTVRTPDGLVHRASYTGSTNRVGKRVWRRSVRCHQSVKGTLHTDRKKVTCMLCIADDLE